MTFTASGTVVVFPGFYAALKDLEVADADSRERELPSLGEGSVVTPERLDPEGHATSPPSRYTEAKLVAKLINTGELRWVVELSPSWPVLTSLPDPGIADASTNMMSPPAGV